MVQFRYLHFMEKGIILHEDYPFRSDVERMLARAKTSNRSVLIKDGITTEKITVTLERTILPVRFSKLYQNKEALKDLSPDACKVIIHIACNIGFDEQCIRLVAKEVGVERRRFSKAMVELMLARVVSKKQLNIYWVNVSIIVVGNLNEEARKCV